MDGLGLAEGRRLGGRYRLEALIGRGGMGQVWRAVDERLRRPVAVKVLPAELAVAEGGLARFEREAETTAALQHPGITVLFDIGGDEDGLTYLVMELLEGEDLRAVIDRHPDGLPVDQAVEFALQLADALAAAHSRGIVHRDIKPANLFVLDGGRLKLCDFGIAGLAAATTRLTRDGGSVGTPLYMAPEQFRGVPADFRSDLYALGCVLHELLTGAPPFGSDAGLPGLLYAHLNEPPPPVRARRPDAPEHLERLVLSLLAKPMDQRPPSAAAVASYLREKDPAPPSAPPTPSPSPFPPPAPPPGTGAHPHQHHAATLPPDLRSSSGPLSGRTLAAVGAALAVAVAACAVAVFAVTGNLPGQKTAAAQPSPRRSAPADSAAVPTTPTTPPPLKIVYSVTGSAPTVSVLYMHPEGGSASQQADPPWTKKFEVAKYTFLHVSGNTGTSGGSVRCRISIDGKVVQERSGSGRFASVSCQYSPYLSQITPAPAG
ncbi:serine/threonine-protein kinase [Actinocorallia libanotica]|uniref:non-specific serine/threonine protein kinase n=1 Tax=Actinocorallia libanotica TaxID=46162 RepID=A0ABN1Q8J7_9ACTN